MRPAKVLWGEGLFLRPQHFQLQDAYHESRLQQVASALSPHGWGLREARIDTEGLAAGTLRLLQASAIFPDGEVYSAPGADELPAPLSLHEATDAARGVTVHLALPLLDAMGGNCDTDGDKGSPRYQRSSRPAPDLFTDSGEAEVVVLRKRPRLLLESQPGPVTARDFGRYCRDLAGDGGAQMD